MKNIYDIFDENKIKRPGLKVKLKLILKILIILIVVVLIGSYINVKMFIKYSEKRYETNEAYVKLSVPNGRISESNDISGVLGGSGTYKIAKNIGGKSVVLEERFSTFGILPFINYSRKGGGGEYNRAGNWPVSIWENGYKKMRFFHPGFKYNEYQNDLENIKSIPNGKVIEMAISFDKPYKVKEMYLLQDKLKPAKITWAWLNEFTKDKIDEFKDDVESNDNKANGINERDTVGIEIYDDLHEITHIIYSVNDEEYNEEYDELIDNLNKSNMLEYKELYEEIMKRGKTSADDAEVLGVVVHGTKEELMNLIRNPLIKATSIGVVTDPVY